jgi:Mrp family chromosome partitioning ATPase
LAWSLASTAARLGAKTLLIELDQRDSSVSDAFMREAKAPPSAGSFADFARSDCGLSDAVREIGTEFAVMRAPPVCVELFSLLSRADAPNLTGQLRRSYDFVVIDGPCVLDGPEIELLAGWAEATLFAVRWGKTDRDVARGASRRLQRSGPGPARRRRILLASILTEVDLKQHVRFGFGDGGELLLAGARQRRRTPAVVPSGLMTRQPENGSGR